MRRSSFLAAGILVIQLVAGCEGTPSTARLDEARRHYDAGHYVAAERAAAEAMDAAGADPARYEAAYLAGLSAYQRGHFQEAEQYLRVATASGDDLIEARSDAMLGLIELHRQRPREGASMLRDAAARLEGEDVRRARQFARLADERAGLDPAGSATGIATRPSTDSPAGANGAYTLQLGAFHDRDRAQRLARQASALARRYGLEPVQVVRSEDGARRDLFLVQMGQFTDEVEAIRMQRALRGVDCIVAQADADLR